MGIGLQDPRSCRRPRVPSALRVLGSVSRVRELRAGLGYLTLYYPTLQGVHPTLAGGQRCKPKSHTWISLPGPGTLLTPIPSTTAQWVSWG